MTGNIRSLYSSRPYSSREWRIAGLLAVSYIAVFLVSAFLLPRAFEFYPASALALVALFFGGPRLSPIVYAVALAAAAIAGLAPAYLVTVPIAVTIQALAGAYILRAYHLDPLFRRTRDTFVLLIMVAAVSALTPLFGLLAAAWQGMLYTLFEWGHAYVSSVFCFFVITPFLLRWFTKPHFSRTSQESFETTVAFAAIIVIGFAYYVDGIQAVSGISLLYFLLVPLFFVAFRLRPRFVTLSLVITSLFAVVGALMSVHAPMFTDRLFRIEAILIPLCATLLVISSLEEELRVNTSLMHSQLETLENAIARVSSESRAKNDFVAILAHELRNPLAPVVSAIELLKLKGPHDPDDVETFDMMTDRMNTIRRLLDDLLDISRISEGKIKLKEEQIDLDTILKRAILSTEHHRTQLHQKLVFKGSLLPLSILGDSLRLEQIFSNLLTNASKYSDPGDTVTLKVRQGDAEVEVEVIDEGIGLDPASVDAIFTPFHQLGTDERTSKGLGIGLALVKSFVEMHGGDVRAASAGPGLGSRFIVTLPFAEARLRSKKAGEIMLESEPAYAPAAPLRSDPLVLLVDDNDSVSGSMGRLLEIEGCTVAYAYESQQAIEQVMALKPDVVFVDADMAHEEGFKVARAIRERGFAGRCIALTSSPEKRRRDGMFEHYLVKPVGLADLRRALSDS